MTVALRRVCVFSGSSFGARESYTSAAQALGEVLVARGIGLVYGGGSVGLMGVIADAVLAGGGEVIGVIPRALATKEIAHQGLADLRVVDSMHERKALMTELADGFVALHQKPIGLLDVDGYFAPLLALIDQATVERFVRDEYRALVMDDVDPARLLERMAGYRAPPGVLKWIRKDET